MEDVRKRKGSENSAIEDEKKRFKFTENVDEDDGIMEFFMLDEDSAAELSNLLDIVATEIPPVKVKFIDDPYSTPLVFQSSTAYVTINGNEETCGSSFSDEVSVMASVDMAGLKRRGGEGVGEEWWLEGRGGEVGGEMESGADVEEFLVNDVFDQGKVDEDGDDEEMWVKFLGEDLFRLSQ